MLEQQFQGVCSCLLHSVTCLRIHGLYETQYALMWCNKLTWELRHAETPCQLPYYELNRDDNVETTILNLVTSKSTDGGGICYNFLTVQ